MDELATGGSRTATIFIKVPLIEDNILRMWSAWPTACGNKDLYTDMTAA